MNRSLITILSLCLFARAAQAQVNPPRSKSYLFPTDVADVRALWVNPAGLVVIPEASIMGELVVERVPDADPRIPQFTFAFNSRGFSLGWQRDLFAGDTSGSTWRAAVALPFPRGAFGFAGTWYAGTGDNGTDIDLGVLYGATRQVTLAATIEHIGRPVVRGVPIPLTGVVGTQWSVFGGRLSLNGEAIASERRAPGESGLDVDLRGGARFTLGSSLPISLITALDLGSSAKIERWTFALTIGGRNQGAAVATLRRQTESLEFNVVSFVAVASNTLTQR